MEKWENASVCFESVRQAHTPFEEETVSLSGGWRTLIQRAEEPLPEGITAPDFPDKKWEKTTVPAELPGTEYLGETVSTGLVPIGRKAPERTPRSGNLAVFRRSFRVPAEWNGRPVILRFCGAGAGLRVWVNGSYAGMSKNALLPSEFEITPFLKPEKNHLCAEVIQYTGNTAAQEPSQWHRWGIWGEVELYSLPVQRIEDLQAEGVFSEEGKPVAIRVRLRTRNAEGLLARAAVMRENKVAFYGEGTVHDDTLCVIIPCPGAALWSPEHPRLYRIAVILSDGVGIYHTRQITFGLRQITLSPEGLHLNGRTVKLQGVGYRPRAARENAFQEDLQRMRSSFLNTVWVRNPLPETFYDLCDETGMLVIDSSCLIRGDDAAEVEQRLVETRRNHPCVILWDLQMNETLLHSLDETRLSVSACYQIDNPSPDRLRQYLSHENIEEKSTGLLRLLNPGTVISSEAYRDRPLLATGLARVLGNGSFPAGEYRRMLLENSQLCGLFLWNWADQTREGCWTEGCLTGLVSEQGVPHHMLRAIQAGFAPIRMVRNDSTVTVFNDDPVRDLQAYGFSCRLTRDGTVEEQFDIALSGAPGTSVTFPVELRTRMFRSGHYALTVTASLSGAECACGSWELEHIPVIRDDNPGGSIRDEDGNVVLRAENMAYTINRATGNLDQICRNGENLLTAPLAPQLCRPATEFDRSQKQLDEWDRLTLRKKLPKPSVFEVDHLTRSVSVSQNVGSGLLRTYRLYTSGALEVELRMRTGKTTPARIGMSCSLPSEYREFSWLGLGPQDTYADRMEGAVYGLHSTDVPSTQDLFPVLQEYGSKCLVRELTLTREDGTGLRVLSPEGISAGCRSWTLEELCTSARPANLPDSGQTTLNLDAVQNGLCSAVIQPHTTYTYRFLLEPVES